MDLFTNTRPKSETARSRQPLVPGQSGAVLDLVAAAPRSPCQNLDFPEEGNVCGFDRTLSERQDLNGDFRRPWK